MLERSCKNISENTDDLVEAKCSKKTNEFGTFCNFTCPEGFLNTGSETRYCLAIGVWTGLKAKCKSKVS